MRRWWTLLLGLLAGLACGCATDPVATSLGWLDSLRQFPGPTGRDVVQLDVAVVEVPAGDKFVDRDLWSLVDEQVVGLDGKAALEDNGLRVGKVGGIPPEGLQHLLTSDRSCINPRRLQLHAGNPTPVYLGPVMASCQFAFHQSDKVVPVQLEDAQCSVVVTPRLKDGGQVALEFSPEIPHGEATVRRDATPDRAAWVLQEHRPTEKFPSLNWEVTLDLNEYAVIGGRSEHAETLGHQFFVRMGEAPPVQRLLVIRACRLAPDPDTIAGVDTGDGEPVSAKSPPLALQAAWATARASGH